MTPIGAGKLFVKSSDYDNADGFILVKTVTFDQAAVLLLDVEVGGVVGLRPFLSLNA